MVSGDFCEHDWPGSSCPDCRAERETPEPFTREERYIVIKRKYLSKLDEARIRQVVDSIGNVTVACVVVENDWPEYEIVWDMIEKRAAKGDKH